MNRPELNDFGGLERELLVDTLELKRNCLITGKNGSRIRVSSSAYQLLQAAKSGMSFDELSHRINAAQAGAQVTSRQLEETYDQLVRRLNEIDDQASKRRLPWGFWLRFRLIPEKWTAGIGSFLSGMYGPYISLVLTAFIAVTFAVAFGKGTIRMAGDTGFFSGYMLFLFSLVIHEFGHASACSRFGARPSEIGFTIYLIYPAFYSDVSSAWQLKRGQRVIVDLGGNYFQLLVGSCFMLAYYLTHWEPLRIAVVMILYAALFSLNPIFKFDGYWMLADFLGVVNLSDQPARIGKFLWGRLLRRPVPPMPWPARITAVLIVYSAVSVVVWSGFLWRIVPAFWYRSSLLVDYVLFIASEFRSKHLPEWGELRTFSISLFFTVIAAAMLWQIARRIVGPSLYRLYLLCKERIHGAKLTITE